MVPAAESKHWVATRDLIKLFIEIPGLGLSVRSQPCWESQRQSYAGRAPSQTHRAHLPRYFWCQSDVEPLTDGLNCGNLARTGFWMELYEGVTLKVHGVHHCTVQWLASFLCTRLSAERAYMLQKDKGAKVLQLTANSFVSGLLCPRMSACIMKSTIFFTNQHPYIHIRIY